MSINLGAAALQAQLLGQFNLNGQFGLAEAEATSGDVSVTSFIPKDPTVGSGIIAESNAAASATLDQTVEQENTNSASITLPPLTVIDPQDEQVLPDLEIAAQLEGVLQVNASLQAAEADATATSGNVSVDQSGSLSSGVDGIVAQSNAAASAELDQSATQTNSDSKTISRAPNDTEGTTFQPVTIDAQLEAVLQANVNLQFAGADAEATSGAVYVTSAGELEAADHGINAQSNAAASADLDQSADQENNNEVTADGTLVLQGQLLGQVNLNVQGAVADADATSGPVTVEQDGVLNVGGDGITAEFECGGFGEP